MRIQLRHKFEDIISLENLLLSWQEFKKGKIKRKDVREFSYCLMDNIFQLHNDFVNKSYKHGPYKAFKVYDPKPRDIHKALARDRLVHHAIYRILYPFFDKVFISDSFSCRLGKGTHKAINRFRDFSYKVSKNNTKTCWILKCDIKKFFANINHKILINVLEEHIPDKDIIWLLREIIDSFHTSNKRDIGLPLGNLTSQLFVNIYMNKFDQFIKHKLKSKYYLRYADDFVILSDNCILLKKQIPFIENFLNNRLELMLHSNKIFINTLFSGIDFLGWIHFSDYRILRTIARKRMIKRIEINPSPETINSYLGLSKHGNTHKIRSKIFKGLDFKRNL
jgi:retron-type reverse transcriptase